MISSAVPKDSLLKIQLAGDYEQARVHVMLHNFLSNSAFSTYRGVAKLTEGQVSNELDTPTNKSDYQKNTDVDAEYDYALQRKLHKKFTCNNLPKPQLLLRPASTSDVHFFLC